MNESAASGAGIPRKEGRLGCLWLPLVWLGGAILAYCVLMFVIAVTSLSVDEAEGSPLPELLVFVFGPLVLWLLLQSRPIRRRRKQRRKQRAVAPARREIQTVEQERKAKKYLAEMKLAAQQEELAMAVREQERAKRNFEDVPARIPRDADDFETVCAEWMENAGFSEVARTPKGPDGGIDVIASNAVGQAKFHPSQKVTGESVRALVGSRVEREKSRALFFHYGPGYTPAAIEVARSTGVELYQLDVDRRRFKRIGNESDDFEEIDVPQEPSW